MNELFEVVHEDDQLLVVNKPAGLVCHPTKGDAYSSLISRVRLYLEDRSTETPGPVHLINRLDRETSGLVIIAKSDDAARGLRRRWEQGLVRKTYIAIVEGGMSQESGCIDAPIGPDTASSVAIKGCVRPDGAPSRTRFERLHVFGHGGDNFSLVRVEPGTGRKHQIRIHLAHLGHPIVGDKIYGSDEGLYLSLVGGRLSREQEGRLRLPNHALHAARLEWKDEESAAKSYAVPPDDVLLQFVGRGKPELPRGAWDWLSPTIQRGPALT